MQDQQKDILISIVIPVKNGDIWLDKTIRTLLGQTLASRTEIIVIDSGSTDRTLSILGQYPVKVVQIAPDEFNHGSTRNLGARLAKGKFVAMTVQDAMPADENWLQHLLDGFDDDKVAGVCGQQIVPHDIDKNPVDWFRPLSPPGKVKYAFASPGEFESFSPDEKRDFCRWDNVTAMYRKDRLSEIPFQATSFAEDALWARDALRAGYSIVYNTAARVYHYHFESPDYTFRRCFTVYYNIYHYFGVKPTPASNEWKYIGSNIKTLVFAKTIGWPAKWKWLLFNYNQRRAIKRAIHAFNAALGAGELEQRHLEICGTPPQALKPISVSDS